MIKLIGIIKSTKIIGIETRNLSKTLLTLISISLKLDFEKKNITKKIVKTIL